MIYVPKEQVSQAKDLIYPVNKSLNPAWHRNNLQAIKNSQEKNRLKREEEEKFVPGKAEKVTFIVEPYKLQQFKNVPSHLYSHTKEWVARESIKHKSPPEKENKLKKKCETIRSLDHPFYNPQKNESLFEKYYAERLKQIKKLTGEHSLSTHNIKIHQTKEQESLQSIAKTREEKPIEAIKKPHLKPPVPLKSDESKQTVELPKISHNYIHENRQLVIDNQVPKKYSVLPEPESAIHKDYGKMPDYLEKYKQEEEKRKEYLKQLEEEATYPKGTKLLKEEERVSTLKSLMESKVTITNIVEKMPITNRSFSIQKRKEDLEKRLEEIENAICIFSKKKVFVKAD